MTSSKQDERISKMIVGSVYPLYVAKVEKKGRTKEELNQIICWLTGFSEKKLNQLLEMKVSFADFFEKAKLPANAEKIKGVICGYRVEEIENPLTKKVRYLDKIVDELAKGWSLEKIMRN